MRLAKIAQTALAMSCVLMVGHAAMAQNATEKLALDLPITIEDLRGQEFLGNLSDGDKEYLVRVTFDDGDPEILTFQNQVFKFSTNFDEIGLISASIYTDKKKTETLTIDFHSMTMTAQIEKFGDSTDRIATGMLAHADFGCWFRNVSFDCPRRVKPDLIAKYRPLFDDIDAEMDSYVEDNDLPDVADVFQTIIKPRIVEGRSKSE